MTVLVETRRPRIRPSRVESSRRLVPVRILRSGRTLYEGPATDLRRESVYLHMLNWGALRLGDTVDVEVHIPPEITGSPWPVRMKRLALVVRIDNRTLYQEVGYHPRRCGVRLAFEPLG